MAQCTLASTTAKLLAEAFSASLGTSVLTYDEFCTKKTKCDGNLFPQPLDIAKLFELSYVSGPFGDKPGQSGVQFFVKCQWESVLEVTMSVHEPVRYLRECLIETLQVSEYSRDLMTLIFAGNGLESDKTLAESGIHDQCTVHLYQGMRGGGGPLQLHIDSSLLDPRFDYDFSTMCDDGTQFHRGGYLYQRPYGWQRYAIKVLDKYSDNDWLGPKGYRVDSAPGEWPVSYHGTGKSPAGNIAEVGYDVSRGRRFKYGRGIYSTPSIDVASKYAHQFTVDGKCYEIVMQNRVCPDDLKTVESSVGEYWLQPQQGKIRPYGICIREVDAV